MNRFNKILIVYIIFVSVLLTNICPINAEPTYIKGSAIKPNTFYDYAKGTSSEAVVSRVNPITTPDDSTAYGYKTATGYGYYPSSSTGGGGTVEAILNKDYTARAQGTAESGLYSIYDFDITSSIIVTGTIVPTINGLIQYETNDFTIGTWNDSGTNKLRITFTSDVAADALVRVSCFTTLPLLAVISANNVSTNDGWLQDGLDAIWIAINDRYTKAETNATIEAAIAAIPTPSGATATEDIGTYISDNKTWEFDADYDTTAILIYRNRIYQPRSLFTTVDVSSKTRVVFNSAINASDEIILISNK